MTTYYLTRDADPRFVPEDTMGPKNGIDESDIDRLGLREKLDAYLAPPKQADKPADKMIRKPADKQGAPHA